MKYVKNNRADEFGTFTQLDGIMKCSAAIATNTALKVAGDVRAWLDTEDHSISRAMFGFVRTSGNF